MFVVEGLELPRPFRIRRLGHVGLNVVDLRACLRFYRELLGLRLSDTIDYRELTREPERLDGLGDSKGYFLRYGSDHHAFVLFNKRVREALDTDRRFRDGVTLNQITWQVGSLAEVVDAVSYLSERGTRISRSGRDTPGSNWHSYVFDPDGHTVELYYGIEQIGWDGRSKPKSMYDRGFHTVPPLPQIGEAREVAAALLRGDDLASGYRDGDTAATHEVGGTLLPRPFAISGLGPVRIFVEDLEVATRFYVQQLGLTLTEERQVAGHRCRFLRANTEHHSLALYPLALRAQLPLRQDTTTLGVGFRLASYAQLRDAAGWLLARGARTVSLPPALFPGMRHAVNLLDPDGHLVQLFAEIEQVGWQGAPRTEALLPDCEPASWPASIQPLADSFCGEPFLGPLA